jgi:hypothetical protein
MGLEGCDWKERLRCERSPGKDGVCVCVCVWSEWGMWRVRVCGWSMGVVGREGCCAFK